MCIRDRSNNSDLISLAQTGTGKTASFTLPLLQQLQKQPPSGKRRIRALDLTPTRELAAQVHDNIVELARYLNLKSTVIFGGVSEKPQISTLNKGVDILIATPGRLLDLHSRGFCSFDALEFFVLDEADRMLDMGFTPQIETILKFIPKQHQTLLFSATLPNNILRISEKYLNNLLIFKEYDSIINNFDKPVTQADNHFNVYEFVESSEEKKTISRKKYMIYKKNNFNVNHKKYDG